MKNLINSVITLLSLLLFFSCNKDDPKPYEPVKRCSDRTRNIDTINLYIRGYWEWVEEYRVTRFNEVEYITPASPGEKEIDLVLSGDTAIFYVNNQIDSVYQFKIQEETEITNFPTDTLPVLVYYSFATGLRKSYVPIMICRNQLLMQHQYVNSIVGERLWIRK
jgi:hypothetical protein